MHRDAMDAMADLRVWIWNVLRVQPAIDRFPSLSAIVRPKRSGRRDRDVNSLRVFRIEKDRVQTHAARARLPFRTGIAAAQTGQFMPRFAAVFRFEYRGVFHARVDVVRIVKRRFQMPDTLEFPRMLGAVVPLVRRDWFACFG